MTSYKLTYFNSRGRAETIRMLFELAGVHYDDVRIDRTQWPVMKPDTPFGQLPILEVDGVTLAQTRAIERFLAKKFGLYGDTELDDVKSDMFIGSMEDMLNPLFKVYGATESQKAELKAKYTKETLPPFLDKFSKFINENGFLMSKRIMWVDVAFFNLLEGLAPFGVDVSEVLEKFPKVKILQEKVQANEKIAQWISKRPATES